jgi:hypothetical protein
MRDGTRVTRDLQERRNVTARRVRAAALGVAVVGIGVLAVALWSAASRAEAATAMAGRGGTEFSAYIDDLPIMPGLSENDEGYAFDLFQGGRLAEARLAGDAEAAVVRGFYAATLAQLGWKASDTEPYVYRRGRERLIFLVEPRRPRQGQRAVRGLEAVFVITPDTQGPAPRVGSAQP